LKRKTEVLKINDIYRLALADFIHKLHHSALPKIYDNFLQKISSVHSYKTRFVDNQNYFLQSFLQIMGKSISFSGVALWTEIEQCRETLHHVTFCKQYRACRLSYHE